MGAALLVAIVFAFLYIPHRKRRKQKPRSISLWSEDDDADIQDPFNGVEADHGSRRIPSIYNDTMSRPYILDASPSESPEPSRTQSHRNSVCKPLDKNGSLHIQNQTDLLDANTSTSGHTSTPPAMSTLTSVPSEPSSRVIIHTDAGVVMNVCRSKGIVDEVIELPPRYHTVA